MARGYFFSSVEKGKGTEAASPLAGEEEPGLIANGSGDARDGDAPQPPAVQPPAPAFCLHWAGKSPISYTNFKHNQMWEMKLLNSFCALGGG